MSGGTWDYEDRRLHDLADSLRSGHARWTSDDFSEELEFPRARAAMAEVLDVAAELLHDLDWFFAGDSNIEDETAWMYMAKSRLERVQFAGRPLPDPPTSGDA